MLETRHVTERNHEVDNDLELVCCKPVATYLEYLNGTCILRASILLLMTTLIYAH